MAAPDPTRTLRLRYPAKCAVCFRALDRGQRAEWNSRRKLAICIPCTQRRPKAATRRHSVAGGSANAEATRRRTRQKNRLRAERDTHPFWGRLRQGLSPEKDAGASWSKGAVGEQQLAASLAPLASSGLITVLHDRRIPGTRANIDHLVIAASGVWVIDAKRYTGMIKRDHRGNIVTGSHVLSIRGRDRTSLIDGVNNQAAKVDAALRATLPAPVRGALCFIDGDWGWRRRPFALSGVLVTWPRALRARLKADGALGGNERQAIADHLDATFPPAS